jgi:hypothetical protein
LTDDEVAELDRLLPDWLRMSDSLRRKSKA